MMTSKMTKSNLMDKVAMNESGMMDRMTSSVWRVTRNVMLMTIVLIGLVLPASAAFTPDVADFETNFGNWVNTAGDSTDWTRDSGGTPSAGTGPTSGASGSTWYVFLEATGGATGNNAYLENSQIFDATANKVTVSFYYHMYGATMGTLNLQVSQNGGAYATIWTLSGDQGNSWFGPIAVDVDGAGYTSGDLQFRFEAIRGTDFTSDVTIDSITISGVDRCAANPPTDLSANAFSPTQVDLSWSDPDASDCSVTEAFTVYRDGNPLAALTDIPCVSGTMNYSDNTAAGLTSYVYTVRATDNDTSCESADSNPGNVTTPACTVTGSLGVVPNETVYGNPVDLTVLNDSNGANSFQYHVTEGGVSGDPFVMTDDFGTSAGTFGNWVPTDENPGNSWALANGGTPSANVGPTADQSGSGYYVYSEASGNGHPYDYWLTSPSLDNTAYDNTLQFYWNMNNDTINTCELDVEASSDNGITWDYANGAANAVLWERNGNNGNSWNLQSVSLNGVTPTGTGPNADKIKIRFRVRATAFQCDVGLDTISINGTTTAFNSLYGPADGTNVDTSSWVDGTRYTLIVSGNDATCGTPLADAVDTFVFDSCPDTNPTTVILASPSSGATVIGAENIGTAGTDFNFPQYRVDDGAWISTDTVWDSRKTHPTSTSAPISNVMLQVRGRDPDCPGKYVYSAPIYVTVDNTCVDDTPSTITVKVGQTVSGPTVDLTSLYTATGSVTTDAGFTYAIDGLGVSTPYDSSAQGTADPKIVKFEVFGRDKTCGDKEVYGYGFVTIDNTCTRGGPTVNFDNDTKYVKSGEYVEYQVRVYNHDSPACPEESFDLSIVSTDSADFTSSITGDTTLVVPAGESMTTKLRVSSDVAGTADWTTNDTTINLVDSGASRSDMPADQTVVTTIYDANSMLHNSITTKSTKHSGLWGTSQAGAKYGEFTCKTCHAKVTTNIKMVATAVNSPKPAEPFPGEGVTVTLKEVTGLDSYGDDGRATNTSSNYICEVCHTADASKANGVNKHAYNLTALGGDSNHFNQQDCIECHEHRTGFQATCDVCHGYGQAGTWWPDSLQDDGVTPNDAYADRLGAHQVHVTKIANYLTSGGDKNDGSATTITDMNNTCVFCHPKPGETNKDGAMHIVDTVGSDVDTADVFMDGTNVGSDGYFKYFDNTDDTNGTYDPTIQRCSNIDCHSNGQFTWSWYGDLVAPGQITDLSGVTGAELGSVVLDWTAPGNDGYTAGKAYGYEVRYSTSPIGGGAAYNSATIAGFPPTTLWPGFSQDMTVTGLAPGTDYYFAIKSFDEAGNWSPVSNSAGPITATGDNDGPNFFGLVSATPAFVSGVVNLDWDAAVDRSEPISYNIWWVTTDQKIDYASAPDATTTSLSYQVTGLTDGVNYYFAVRAKDSYGNVDQNTVQKEAIPQSPNETEYSRATYYMQLLETQACGNQAIWSTGIKTGELAQNGYPCSANTRTEYGAVMPTNTPVDLFRWTMPTAENYPRNITGGISAFFVREQTEANDHNLQVSIGYTMAANPTSDADYVWLGTSDKPLKPGNRGTWLAGLSSITGTIPSGGKVAIKLRHNGPNNQEFDMRYGSTSMPAYFTLFEQPVNTLPAAFAVTAPVASSVNTGLVTISWENKGDVDGDPVSYDVYASLDNGSTYPITIAEGMKGVYSVNWDTVADGLGLSAAETQVKIKVEAKDGYNHSGSTPSDHTEAVSGTFTVNNSADTIPPAAITDLHAEHRPKAGSVFLYWSAPGDDGVVGVATEFDIRYSQSIIDAGNFESATTVTGEPVPDLPGTNQGFEVLGLNPNELYFFAIKTRDEVPNWSGISNVPSSVGGPECGVCHSTPPDQPERAGTHAKHGYTQVDCSKCHGAEAVSFTNDHSDGVNKVAFNNPKFGYTNKAYGPTTETADKVIYHVNGNDANAWLYDDANGGGGYNDIDPGGDNIDNGSCSGFNASGVTGCHGAAGTDPDGAGPKGILPAPVWGDSGSVSCAMCHGDDSRPNSDPYGRPFEDPRHDSKYAGNREIFKAAPPIDLDGNVDSNAAGQHLRHLNVSYRYTGDSCKLCHLNNEHADGTVDVVMDPTAAGPGAQWVPEATGPDTPGTCAGTSGVRCHGNNTSEPKWEVRSDPNVKLVNCNECHGFQGKVFDPPNNFSEIPHVKDQGQVQNCTYCHVEGHPRSGYAITNITKANPAVVTSVNHNMHTGDTVLLHVEGMSEIDHWYGTITIVDKDNFSLDGVNSTGYGDFDHGYWKMTYAAKAISTITKANPAVVTSVAHGLSTEDNIQLSVTGMVELDGYHGPITKIDDNSFSLDGVDSSAFGDFSSGDWIKIDGTIMVPNYTIGGIDYSSGGIHLKRVVGGRLNLNNGDFIDTEAETCWGCHEDQPVLISEWGTNQQVLTGNSPYDYGSLDQTSWVGATWTSPNFSYKTGAIASTHSVNPGVTGPGVDTDEQIRCSYCHDVHDLNKAQGDNVSGRPYLRGTWKGNPYKEDGAPGRYDAEGVNSALADYYPATVNYGGVPRGAAGTTEMGGYWIDQNSNNPTAGWTLKESAGLCTMCHGSDVNNMDKFGTNDWVGTNGHSNAVIGGSGVFKYNVYDPPLRQEGTTHTDPGMGYQDTDPNPIEGDRWYGLRNMDSDVPSGALNVSGSTTNNTMYGVAPYINNVAEGEARYAFGTFTWGLDHTVGAIDLQYHRFSCSKCHNPHASRLPRLMITNCLDVSHNKWDNVFVNDPDWTDGNSADTVVDWSTVGVMPYTGNDVSGDPRNRQFAYAQSAQNCHRYVDTDMNTGTDNAQEKGWNKVTPWNETSTWFNSH